jgi:short-chain fatty acids transporter
MLKNLGDYFTAQFKKIMPDAFVFALVLTLIVALLAALFVEASLIELIDSWYKGFWVLLEFGMQMSLLIVTGYAIALSPFIDQKIESWSAHIKSPNQVYLSVAIFGLLLSFVSWGWVVIAAVFGRKLALRVSGINYPFLIAITYFSNNIWSTGLSSSIPLLVNTENNYLIDAGILSETISTTQTLGSNLNFAMILFYLSITPLLIFLLKPKKAQNESLNDLLSKTSEQAQIKTNTPISKSLSDRLNHSKLLIYIIALAGGFYVFQHFSQRGFELNLNLMIFIFLMIGLILHRTPFAYGKAVQKGSSNVAAILYQFPFYAGIMGIMIHTGLANYLAEVLIEIAEVETLPSLAFVIGGIVNFAIPSGGGEFAVIGPSILEATLSLAQDYDPEFQQALISKTILAITYGESLTNLLQPFFILMVLPVMSEGTNLQARDVMGYLVIPFILCFTGQLLLINLVGV